MKQVTHIISVGEGKETILDGLKQHLIHKAVLLINNNNEECLGVANELENALNGFADVKRENLEDKNIFEIALKLVDIIKKERASKSEVLLNVTSSSGNIGIACYLASLTTDTKIYTTVTNEKNGDMLRIQEILPFPKKEIPKEQVCILEFLNEKEVESLDELIIRIKPKIKKNTTLFNNERARICHHIKSLKNNGLIETEKVGKTLKIEINSIGELYLKGKK
jgi:DNA-binding transcriptional ArsR family regulator